MVVIEVVMESPLCFPRGKAGLKSSLPAKWRTAWTQAVVEINEVKNLAEPPTRTARKLMLRGIGC
jgi:hypothetical protein